MDRDEYQRLLDEALSKAFAARACNVRIAYFDLASFYHEKLGGHAQLTFTHKELGAFRAGNG